MASIIWEQVAHVAPELSDLDGYAQELILAYANTALAIDNFGGEDSRKLEYARVLVAAHMGTMVLRRGVAGPLTAESMGGVSETYAFPQWARHWDLTSYGTLFLTIVKGTAARAGTVL
jgi:hypothetical protein